MIGPSVCARYLVMFASPHTLLYRSGMRLSMISSVSNGVLRTTSPPSSSNRSHPRPLFLLGLGVAVDDAAPDEGDVGRAETDPPPRVVQRGGREVEVACGLTAGRGALGQVAGLLAAAQGLPVDGRVDLGLFGAGGG